MREAPLCVSRAVMFSVVIASVVIAAWSAHPWLASETSSPEVSWLMLAMLAGAGMGVGGFWMLGRIGARERVLAETEARFASAFEQVAVGMTHIAPDGRWLRVNATLCRMLGYSREALLGKNFAEITHPDDVARDMAAKVAMEKGEIAVYVAEKRYIHRDGSIVWVRVVVSPVGAEAGPADYYVTVVEHVGERKAAEAQAAEALREQRRWLAIIESAGHGLWEWSAATNQVRIEHSGDAPALAENSVWTSGGSMDDWLLRVHPEDDRQVRDSLVAHLRGDTALWQCEHRVRLKGDEFRWLRLHGRAVARDRDGRATRLVGTTTDITAHKQAELAARAAQLRWQFALESGDHGLWDWNRRDDTVFFSPRWKTMLGCADTEIGNTLDEWTSRVHPEDLPAAMLELEAHFDGRTPTYTHEHRMRHKDGSWRWVLDRGKVIERDADGAPLRVIGTDTDVTERRAAEAELRARDALLRDVFDAVSDALLVFGPCGAVVHSNRAAEVLFGASVREARIDDVAQLGPHESRRWGPRLLARVRHQRALRLGGVLYGQDGQRFDIEIDGAPTRADDAGRYLVVIRDVSEARRIALERFQRGEMLEAQVVERTADLLAAKDVAEKANRAKSEFLANMSHEIRTPMNAIIGLSGQCLKTTLDARQRDYVEKVNGAAQALLAIVDDVLDVSRIEAQRLVLEHAPFDVREVVGEVAALLLPRALQKELEWIVDIDDNVPRVLTGDALRLRQILINLAGNAIKFTERGQVAIRVRANAFYDTQVAVGFSVIDTGIGIDAAQQTHLFAPFAQADSSTSRRFGGSGLGLAISRRLAEAMDGRLTMRSTAGEGSSFYFEARFDTRVAAGAPDTARELPAAHDLLDGMRVLIVEDNPLNQQLAVELLEEAGVHTTVADSGDKALRQIEAQRFDLVLMDIQMPGMDGYTATGQLRAMPAHADLPIIAMTAHAMAEERARCLAAGMDDILTKPVVPALLYATLARYRAGGDAQPLPANDTADPAADDPVTPEALPEATDSALNDKIGLRYSGGNPDLYSRLLRRFHETQFDLMARLDAADEAEAHRIGHTLKSSAGSIGAMALADAARDFEAACESGDTRAVENLRAVLGGQFALVMAEIGVQIDATDSEPE